MNPNYKQQELRKNDRVFCKNRGRHGTVIEVTRYPMAIGGSYWIKVQWDGQHRPEDCLDYHVGLL